MRPPAMEASTAQTSATTMQTKALGLAERVS